MSKKYLRELTFVINEAEYGYEAYTSFEVICGGKERAIELSIPLPKKTLDELTRISEDINYNFDVFKTCVVGQIETIDGEVAYDQVMFELSDNPDFEFEGMLELENETFYILVNLTRDLVEKNEVEGKLYQYID